jgi:hypothetical protein
MQKPRKPFSLLVLKYHCILAREATARANEHVRRGAEIIASWRKAA